MPTDPSVRALLDRHGSTYAAEAGITLADQPQPLYQVLVLATLLSARIRASVAVAAARALSEQGWRSPQAMVDAGWAPRARALNRAGYARYDERTSRMLGEGAELLLDKWRGDLRRLHADARGDRERLRQLLMEFKGIGEVGADVFSREAQGVWADVHPFADDRALAVARRLGLPAEPAGLAGLVDRSEMPRLVAALVRSGLAGDADELRAT